MSPPQTRARDRREREMEMEGMCVWKGRTERETERTQSDGIEIEEKDG